MSDRQVISALGFGVLVLVISLMGVFSRGPARPALALPPMVGRSAADVARGVDPLFASVPRKLRPKEREERRMAKAIAGLLDPFPGPKGAHRVIILAYAGDPPRTRLEEGDPWHLLLKEDASLQVTHRLRLGRRAVPPGLPLKATRKAWILVVPHAGRFSKKRRQVLMLLLDDLTRRLHKKGPVLVAGDRVKGSRYRWPRGISRTLFRLGPKGGQAGTWR